MGCEAAVSAETILNGLERMSLDDTFRFRCNPAVECFGKCCHDVTIVLTPYDVLRLKRAAKMESAEFLEKHTLCPRAPEQKFPVVILKMDGEDKHCPFVSERGCGVYNDRPWACRMYPLGAAEPKVATEKDQPFHFVIRESLCHGHDQGEPVAVRDWIGAQGAEAYEMMSAAYKELTLHDYWEKGKPLSEQQAAMLYLACYDLDRFRRFVFETRFLDLFEVDEMRVDAMRGDDTELLEFAMQWLRFSLFSEKSMKPRRGAAPRGSVA